MIDLAGEGVLAGDKVLETKTAAKRCCFYLQPKAQYDLNLLFFNRIGVFANQRLCI